MDGALGGDYSEAADVARRLAIRNGEESVAGSTALLRGWFTSADFRLPPRMDKNARDGHAMRGLSHGG